MRRLAISTWSLDGILHSGVPLLSLPAQLVQHGITLLEEYTLEVVSLCVCRLGEHWLDIDDRRSINRFYRSHF
jgi:hypothetical protein